jgi:hypothetical protein
MPVAILGYGFVIIVVGWMLLSFLGHMFVGISSGIIDLFGSYGTSIIISLIFLGFSFRNIKRQSFLFASSFITQIEKRKKVALSILISFILLSTFFKIVNLKSLAQNISSYYYDSNKALKNSSVFILSK